MNAHSFWDYFSRINWIRDLYKINIYADDIDPFTEKFCRLYTLGLVDIDRNGLDVVVKYMSRVGQDFTVTLPIVIFIGCNSMESLSCQIISSLVITYLENYENKNPLLDELLLDRKIFSKNKVINYFTDTFLVTNKDDCVLDIAYLFYYNALTRNIDWD